MRWYASNPMARLSESAPQRLRVGTGARRSSTHYGSPRTESANAVRDVDSGPTGIRASGLPLATLASLLSSSVGGTVLDRTGLTGTYDIELPMSMLTGSLQAAAPSASPNPNPNPNPNAGVSLPTLPGNDGPSVFEAVKDLGLKLERRREPIDVLVIESVEQPDED